MLTQNTDILRAEVAAHIAADLIMRKVYWKDGKGCFIGCLAHSNDPAVAIKRFGLPKAVLRIAENIFEALPDADAKAFFAAFPDAVGRDGKDLSRFHWAFLGAELRALPKTTEDVQKAINLVITGMDLLASGNDWPAADAVDAYAYATFVRDAADLAAAVDSAADAAAEAANVAAYAAAAATFVRDAADAAAAAVDSAADAAASSATNVARIAAYAEARMRQRDTFLSLIATA